MDKVTFHDLVIKLKELAKKLERTPTLKEFEKSGVSKRQIHNHKYSELCKAADIEPNRRPQDQKSLEVIVRPPKILMFDIETSSIVAKVWGLFDQNISLNQIDQDWFVLSYAAKWYGEDQIHYQDQRDSVPISDDRILLEGIHKLLSEADYVCGHNAARFDVKKLNARFIKHNMNPLPQLNVIDTLKIARRIAAFTSNKLEYLAKFLGCDNAKSSHGKFTGMELWNQTMLGNLEAFKEMEDYNKMDVIVLEQVYEKLVRYDPSISFQSSHQKLICTCGGTEFFKSGFRYTKTGVFRVFECRKCGKSSTAKENLIDKDVRKTFFK
jgi:uncharacterized protein YprB with RNaseH-like and TPR domain